VILSSPIDDYSDVFVASFEPIKHAPFIQNFSDIVVQASSPGRDSY
jgi:hypothetical protein